MSDELVEIWEKVTSLLLDQGYEFTGPKLKTCSHCEESKSDVRTNVVDYCSNYHPICRECFHAFHLQPEYKKLWLEQEHACILARSAEDIQKHLEEAWNARIKVEQLWDKWCKV